MLGGRIVYTRRELILAAGAIHTPQILELSGIGDANVLSALNVPVVVDLPGVGNNLQDHALLRLEYPCTLILPIPLLRTCSPGRYDRGLAQLLHLPVLLKE